MNAQIREFLRKFNQVRVLTEEPALRWEEASSLSVSRPWFELSQLSPDDRVEFTKDFWLSRLPLHLSATPAIEEFFRRLSDVVVIAGRQTNEEPWRAELIYSLADNSSFFRGLRPASHHDIEELSHRFNIRFPRDYCAFFLIHDGFGKLTETGLLRLEELTHVRDRVIERIVESPQPLRFKETWLDPHWLFPFYEEYGLESFQCFNADWYPGSEMGNVHFSTIDWTLSDVEERAAWAEELAYPTFLEWLADFLHGSNSCT